jgi:hypothetical protein
VGCGKVSHINTRDPTIIFKPDITNTEDNRTTAFTQISDFVEPNQSTFKKSCPECFAENSYVIHTQCQSNNYLAVTFQRTLEHNKNNQPYILPLHLFGENNNTIATYKIMAYVEHHGESKDEGHYTADIICHNLQHHFDDAQVTTQLNRDQEWEHGTAVQIAHTWVIAIYKKKIENNIKKQLYLKTRKNTKKNWQTTNLQNASVRVG